MSRAVRPNQPNDVLKMMRGYAHPAVLKRLVHGVRKTLRPKLAFDTRVDQDIDCAGDPHFWKTLAADSRGLALIDQRHGCMFCSIADRCGFTVIQRRESGTDHEALEVPSPGFPKTDDFNDAAVDKLTQPIGVMAATRPAGLKFVRDHIGNDDLVGQRCRNRRRAAGRDQVDDRTGVGHKFRGGISQRG
jgi:hypothetical protein